MWSDVRGGERGVPLAGLADGPRSALQRAARETLSGLCNACRTSPRRDLLLACLTVEGPEAVRVCSDRVVLAGWGAVPRGLVSPDQLSTHHAATLGPMLEEIDPPRFALAETPARVVAAEAALGGGRRGLAVATSIAAVALLVLLLPRVLRGYGGADPVDYAAANAALEQQIAAIDGALRESACAVPGPPRLQPAPPGGRRSDGDRATPGSPGAGRPAPTLPVQPSSVPVPAETLGDQPSGARSLAAFLNKSTVLIVTSTGTGSGFFISPDHILTNRHVVEDADEKIFVGNKLLARMLPADIVGTSRNSEIFEPDYALLKLRSGASENFLPFAAELPYQLENVIASGFPGIVLKTDAAFERLQEGDAQAVPDSALTAGAVVVVQSPDKPTPVILHRASISAGNSGGPLTDECGRVVGINTFVRGSSGADDRMNYSLAASSAVAFLKGFGVAPKIVPGTCTTALAGGAGGSAPPRPDAAPAAGGGSSAGRSEGEPSRPGVH